MKHYEKLAKEYAALKPTSDTIDEVAEDSFLAGYQAAMEEILLFLDDNTSMIESDTIHTNISDVRRYLNRETE